MAPLKVEELLLESFAGDATADEVLVHLLRVPHSENDVDVGPGPEKELWAVVFEKALEENQAPGFWGFSMPCAQQHAAAAEPAGEALLGGVHAQPLPLRCHSPPERAALGAVPLPVGYLAIASTAVQGMVVRRAGSYGLRVEGQTNRGSPPPPGN